MINKVAQPFARIGYFSRGLIYLTIGFLALVVDQREKSYLFY
jgi:hypothetical protein